MVLSYNPLRVFLPLGLVLGVVGFGKLGFDWATQGPAAGGQHAADPVRRRSGARDRPARRPRRAADQAARRGRPRAPVSAYESVPTGNTYDKYASSNPIERRLVAKFLRQLEASMLSGSAPARMLEVGAGEGEVVGSCRGRRLPDVPIAGARPSRPGLAERWASDRFAGCSPTSRAPVPRPTTFDLVLAIEVLEHVPDPDAARCARSARRRRDVVLSVPREPIWRVRTWPAASTGRTREHARSHPALEPPVVPPIYRGPLRRQGGARALSVDDRGRRSPSGAR